jgi:RHS repeat-associated protein
MTIPGVAWATEPWVHSPSQREPAAPEGLASCGGPAAFHLPDEAYPIYFASGEFYTSAIDMRIKGVGMDLVWARVYGSNSGPDTAQGNGWDFSYGISIAAQGGSFLVRNGCGRSTLYAPQGDGSYTAPGYLRRLSFDAGAGAYMLKFPDAGVWNFRPIDGSPASGKIASIVDRNSNAITFAYNAQGRLVTITDTLNRNITIAYTAAGMIQSVTDFTGNQVRYTYSSSGNLLSARSPVVTGTPHGNDFLNGRTWTYTYSAGLPHPALNGNLLTIHDSRGAPIVTNTYHATTNPNDPNFDRCIRFVQDVNEILDVVYVPQPGGGVKAILNDGMGNVKEFTYDALGEGIIFDELTGRADPELPTTETENRPGPRLRPEDPERFRTTYEYENADFLMTRKVFPNFNEEQFVYDTANTARRSQGNLLEHRRLAGPLGGDQAEHVDLYEYLPGQGGCCGANFVTRHINPRGFQALFTYDIAGNRETATYPDDATESWAYNTHGQVVKHVLSDNGSGCRRVDTYEYFASGPSSGYLQREIVDATDPAACGGSHFNITTTYQTDARGNVTARTDPRGNTELSEYNQVDELFRHRSAPAGGDQRIETLYFYDAAGNVARVDSENRDETGARPAANTHFSIITDHDIRNSPIRVAREFGTANLANNVLTTDQIPVALRPQFAISEYVYDHNHDLVLERYPEAVRGTQPFNTRVLAYDERRRLFQSTRAPGAPGPGGQSTVQYNYDWNGNTQVVLEGLEGGPHATQSVYDGFDRPVITTDALGNVTEYRYDANGNAGGFASDDPPVPNPFAARRSGQLLDVPGSEGNVRLSEVMYTYDRRDRRIREDVRHFDTENQSPIGDGQATTITSYTGTSQILSTQDDNGNVSLFAFDTANRRKSLTDLRGNSTTLSYDASGNLTSTVRRDRSDLEAPDQLFTMTSTFDALNRQTSSTDSAGNTRLAAYDSRGDRVLETDARGVRTRRTFDGMTRHTATAIDMNNNGVFTDEADIVTSQTWDRDSRLTSQTDDAGNTTSYQQDALNRIVRTTYADGTFDQTSFDVHGNPVQATDANGTVVATTFDDLERPLSRQITRAPGVLGTTSEILSYDGRGRIIRAQNDDSLVVRGTANASGYDSESNILRESQRVLPSGPMRNIIASYNGVGNQTRLTYPSGRSVSRLYDNINRLQSIVDDQNPGTMIGRYSYVGPNRVERLERGGVARTDFTYDGIDGQPNPPDDFGVGRIVRTRHSVISSGAVIDDRTYAWDPMSNKTRRHDIRAGGPQLRHDYFYDDARRLTQTVVTDAAANTVRDESYTLDNVGNRREVAGGLFPGVYSLDATLPEPADLQVNQYTRTSFDARTYDRAGNLVSYGSGCAADFNADGQADFFDYLDFAAAFDAGDISADFNHDAQVDFFDYLDFVQAFDTGCDEPVSVAYDFRTRMIEHRASTVTRFAYDYFGRRIEKTADATGSPVRTRYYYDGWQEIEEQNGATNSTLATYVFGSYIDEAISMRRGSDFYYLNDDNYNVMAVTDSSGAVAERVEYQDFGRPEFFTAGGTPLEESAIGNPLLFTGRRYDPETGWFYYRTRYLDPVAGKFTTKDGIGNWGDANNLGNASAYVGNSPWSALDPLGLTLYCPGQGRPCVSMPWPWIDPNTPPCGELRGFPCTIGAIAAPGPGGPSGRGPGIGNMDFNMRVGGGSGAGYFGEDFHIEFNSGGAGGCDINPWLPGCPCGGYNPPASCFGFGGASNASASFGNGADGLGQDVWGRSASNASASFGNGADGLGQDVSGQSASNASASFGANGGGGIVQGEDIHWVVNSSSGGSAARPPRTRLGCWLRGGEWHNGRCWGLSHF